MTTYNRRLSDLLDVHVFFRLPRLGPTTDPRTLVVSGGSWVDQRRIVGPHLLSLMMLMGHGGWWSRIKVGGKNSGAAAFGRMLVG